MLGERTGDFCLPFLWTGVRPSPAGFSGLIGIVVCRPPGTLILAPSRNRSTPSTTTLSPAARPSSTRHALAVAGANFDGAARTRLRWNWRHKHKSPGAPIWTAAEGTSGGILSVSTISLTLTNWFGNSASSSLAKVARNLTVPVVISIWLSTVVSDPAASCAAVAAVERQRPATPRRPASFLINCGMASCGTVKITEIGCICVMMTTPLGSLACT